MSWLLYLLTVMAGFSAWFMALVAGSFGTSDSTKAKMWFGFSLMTHQLVILAAYFAGRLYAQ